MRNERGQLTIPALYCSRSIKVLSKSAARKKTIVWTTDQKWDIKLFNIVFFFMYGSLKKTTLPGEESKSGEHHTHYECRQYNMVTHTMVALSWFCIIRPQVSLTDETQQHECCHLVDLFCERVVLTALVEPAR